MNDDRIITDYRLEFKDGPAAGQRVMLSVPPTETRWFCVMPIKSGRSIDWWVIDEAPPRDDDVEVTEYVLDRTYDSDDETVVIFGVK